MINSVKLQGDGYLVNGTLSVPMSEGNRDYQEVQEWITAGGTVEPEFTDTEQLKKDQFDFRADRDKLINQADIEIYKLEDNGQDTTAYRAYRQALRDSTIGWVLPVKP